MTAKFLCLGFESSFSKSFVCSTNICSFSFKEIGSFEPISFPEKNQGLPKTPRPIITPSQPYFKTFSSASCKLMTSPLPMSKTSFLLFSMIFFIFMMYSHLAGTSDNSLAVRKWMVKAEISSFSSSGIQVSISSLLKPILVFTETGIDKPADFIPACAALMISRASCGFLIRPAPAP